MAFATEDLDVRLRLVEDTVNDAVRKAEEAYKATKKASEEAGEAGDKAAKNTTASVVSLEASLALATRAWGALRGAADAAFSLVEDSARQRTGIFRLERNLELRGLSGAIGQIEEFAASQQRMTEFGDDVTREVVNQYLNMTEGISLSTDRLIADAALIQDIMATRGASVQQAGQAVAQVAAGQFRAVRTLVPGLREQFEALEDISDAQERGRAGMELLTRAFGGQAQAVDETTLGIARARNAWGDFREALGDSVSQALVTSGVLDDVVETLEGLSQWTADHRDDIAAFFRTMADAASDAFDIVKAGFEAMKSAFELAEEFANSIAGRDIIGQARELQDRADAIQDRADEQGQRRRAEEERLREQAAMYSQGSDFTVGPNAPSAFEAAAATAPDGGGSGSGSGGSGESAYDRAVREQQIANEFLQKRQEFAQMEADAERERLHNLFMMREEALQKLIDQQEQERAELQQSLIFRNELAEKTRRYNEAAAEAEAAAAEAREKTVLGSLDAIMKGALPFFDDLRAKAIVQAAYETAESAAAFASLNIPGGIAHAFAAGQYIAAAAAARSKGRGAGSNAGAGAGGGGRSNVRSSNPTPPQFNDRQGERDRERLGNVTLVFNSPTDGYKAGRDAIRAINDYSRYRTGLSIEGAAVRDTR